MHMRYSFYAVLIGFFLDLIFGDPYWLWHPVRGIGFLIKISEKILRKLFPKTKRGEFFAGLCLTIAVTVCSAGIPVILLFFLYRWNISAGLFIESIMCYQLLALKSLKTESMKVYEALRKGDLPKARYAVSMIVGRDTENLDETGITKAAVETIAENTSDGVIAPLIYLMLGGAGLGFFYKSVNTMDSMVGYKNERYLYFGRCAAKLDDVLNFIPARISACFMVIAAFFLKLDARNAFKIYRRDKKNHASPNSAHTEAAAAGALQIQLAGDAYYFGVLHKKPSIGENKRPVVYEDIKRMNRLLYMTSCFAMLVFSVVRAAWEYVRVVCILLE